MRDYIFGRKNLIHIIDLKSTLRGLIRGANILKNIAARGQYILIVGTKRQARSVVFDEAQRAGMPYVSDRWLGGTLTNFMTIRSRLKRLNELEQMEESGQINIYSKKDIARFRRELHKLHRNLSGIRDMVKLPGALVVIDPGREGIAVKEANKLEIPVIGLVDTDTNPGLVDIVIPCNDDAFRSIKIVLARLVEAVLEGKASWEEKRSIDQKVRAEAAPPPRQKPTRRRAEPRRRPSAPRAKSAPKARTSGKAAPAAGLKADPPGSKQEAPELKEKIRVADRTESGDAGAAPEKVEPEKKTEPREAAPQAQPGTEAE